MIRVGSCLDSELVLMWYSAARSANLPTST